MQSCQSGGGVRWCRAAVLLLTLCLTNKCGSAITFEEFVGYPFNESNGYSIFPRELNQVRGLPIPVPFPYFGRTFSYANVSAYNYCKFQYMPVCEVQWTMYFMYCMFNWAIEVQYDMHMPCRLCLL